MSFSLSFNTQRQVHRHLVTVKVGVESLAGQWVKHNRVAFHKNRLEGLNAHSMKRRCTVKQNRMLMNHFFENIPDRVITPLNHSFGALNRIGKPVHPEFPNNERLIQLESYFLWQATLVEF